MKRYGDVDSQNEVSIEGGNEYSNSENVHKNSLEMSRLRYFYKNSAHLWKKQYKY
jgi:hypothetical protein